MVDDSLQRRRRRDAALRNLLADEAAQAAFIADLSGGATAKAAIARRNYSAHLWYAARRELKALDDAWTSATVIAGHAAGSRFVMLDPEAMLAIDPPLELLGAALLVRAEGVGDAPGAPAGELLVRGRALRPLSPTALRLARIGGDIEAGWIRRSRAGWLWSDGIDAPLAEDRKEYLVTAALDGVVVHETVTQEPTWRWLEADIVAAGPGATTMRISVAQLGSAGAGEPATQILALTQ